jgi:histidine phosphotransferase ChpT
MSSVARSKSLGTRAIECDPLPDAGIEPFLLAELLCARLCHDLAGAVGAAAAGAELLEAGELDGATVQLVADSAAGAVARLKFLRAMFGPGATPKTQGELRAMSEAFLASSVSSVAPPPRLVWRDDGRMVPSGVARLLLATIALGRDALGRGGLLTVEPGGVGEAHWGGSRVVAAGPGAALPAGQEGQIAGYAGPDGPRGVVGYWAGRMAERLGLRLGAIQREDEVILTLSAGRAPPAEGP